MGADLIGTAGGAEPRPYKLPRKKEHLSKVQSHLLFMAEILQQLVANLMPAVSGGAYQDIREVTTEWNDA